MINRTLKMQNIAAKFKWGIRDIRDGSAQGCMFSFD
jgi:hypothetical protein